MGAIEQGCALAVPGCHSSLTCLWVTRKMYFLHKVFKSAGHPRFHGWELWAQPWWSKGGGTSLWSRGVYSVCHLLL